MDQLRRRKLNCFCGVLLLLVNMGILSSSFPVYFPYIRELTGFTNTQIYLLTTMRQIFAMLVMTQADRFFRILDIKKGTMLTFAVASAAFAVLALAPDPRFYYLATSLFGIAYGLGGMIPASILLRRWYPDHSGTAIGIAATGSGLGAMVVPYQATALAERFGLSAAFAVQSVIILLLMIPLFLFISNWPEGEGPGSQQKSPGPAGPESGETALPDRAPSFRLMNYPRLPAAMILMGLLGFQPAAGFSMLYRTSGYTMSQVAMMISLMGLFLIPGKILVGQYADRYGGRRMLISCSLVLSATLVLFSFTARLPLWFMVLVLLVFSVSISEGSVGISVIAGDFTRKAPECYAKALKSCQFFYALGGLLFSTVNGISADLTGSYAPAYLLYAAACFLMLAVLLPGYPEEK